MDYASRACLLAVVVCGLLSGCGGSGVASGLSPSKVRAKDVASNRRFVDYTRPDKVASFTKLSPIEEAQKDYLDAYNEYVRLLRESGPQTIETLQALAVYQKNYQLYQMLIKAGAKEALSPNQP